MSEPVSANLSGKTALVTGATSGIGKEIARGLARLGARVVIGARDADKGAAVRVEIVKELAGAEVEVGVLDVSSRASIEAFAKAWPVERVDVLVNNAGAWFSERRQSVDGWELTFATNVLGPHLLTKLLLPKLRGRVVNIVSALAASYDASDLMFEKRKYDGFKAYTQSKQALRMLTWGLAARLDGKAVTVNGAAPGLVRTEFNQNAHGFTASMIDVMMRLFGVSPAKGADTPLWVAAAPELDGVTGKYFDDRKEKDGKFREPAAIADLERKCEEMVVARRAAA
jgi:NAD(P)-dependent dehydrogenase (short-subunit alcohol dehydrogenase family)